MGRLRIMGGDGDREIKWPQDDPDGLLTVKRDVEDWLAHPGHLAFGFKRPYMSASEKLSAFDPRFAAIVLVLQENRRRPWARWNF